MYITNQNLPQKHHIALLCSILTQAVQKTDSPLPQPRNFLRRTFWHASCYNTTCPWSTENLQPRKKRLSVLVKRPNRLTLRVDFTTFNARSEKRPPTASSPDGLLTYRRSIEKSCNLFKTEKTRRKATLCPILSWARESLCFFQVCKYLRWTRDAYRALFRALFSTTLLTLNPLDRELRSTLVMNQWSIIHRL